MEDQSTDTGDLTADADADTASVPQGKAGRSRHRLPRQKAQSAGHGESPGEDPTDMATEAPTEMATEAPAEAAAEVEVPAELPADEASASAAEESVAEVEPAEAGPEPTESATGAPAKRRRLSWGRQMPARAPTVAGPETVEATTVDPVEPAVASEDTTGSEPESDSQEPEPEPILVPHRPAGRGLKYAAVAAAVLFVAAGAFAGATVQPYVADRAAVQTKFTIAETAANAITTLWTYTPDDMDQLPDRSARYLGGDFAADYRRYIDAIAAPNKQAQVSNNTQVLGAAVESLTPTEATAIVYTNSVATSPVTKGIPSLRYLSYRLTMKRDDNRWLITQMVAVTKLDLTPRL